MKQPLISIIIPFYNEEKYLFRAINSVLNQTYENIELILVDDGSIDSSNDIARKICEETPRCRLIETQNLGPGMARNEGLKNSKGDLVAFLDADDEYEKDAIQKMNSNLTSLNTDLSICMYTLYNSKQDVLKNSKWTSSKILSKNHAIELLIKEKLIPTVWGKLFKKVLIDGCVFPDFFWKEDDVFMLQYLKKCNTVSILDEHLIRINSRNSSLTRQIVSKKMIQDISYSFEQQYLLIENQNLESVLLKNQIATFLNLLLIIKIDWEKIQDKENVLNLFNSKIDLLEKKSKKNQIGFKKWAALMFLKYSKTIGWKTTLLVVGILKGEKLKELKEVKS